MSPPSGRFVCAVEEFGQLVGHGFDGEARLKSYAHGEMSAARLRRGGLPDKVGARFEYLYVQRCDVLVLAGNLACPKRSLERLVQKFG